MSTLNVAGTQTFTGAAAADPRLGGVKGKTSQYQLDAKTAGGATITPADGSMVGTKGGNPNIKITGQPGTYANNQAVSSLGGTGTGQGGNSGAAQGSVNIKLVDPLIQNSTDPLFIGQIAATKGGTATTADDFLPSGPSGTGVGIPVENAAQLAAAGKSLTSGRE